MFSIFTEITKKNNSILTLLMKIFEVNPFDINIAFIYW